MMDKHILWSWAVKNSVDMICWTALAIAFGKWWIALFAALFISSLKSSVGKYRICDSCGKHSPYAESHNEALEKAAAEGWLTRKNGDTWEDFCPECRKKMEGG